MTNTPSTQRLNVHIRPHPPVLDSIQLQDIQLPLPTGPDAWHRPGKPQPCSVSLKLSYSSATAAAAADDVSLSLDYGKLFRRLEKDIAASGSSTSTSSTSGTNSNANGEDVRVTAGTVASCGLGLLDETAAGVRRMSHPTAGHGHGHGPDTSGGGAGPGAGAGKAIDASFGQCEVWLHLPKAILRADEGLKYRSVTVWGYRQDQELDQNQYQYQNQSQDSAMVEYGQRCPVVLEEEFRIDGIRCYCILGVNSHERVEKQAVVVSLEFKGPGQLAWGSAVMDTYQEMTRVVAEVFSSSLLHAPFSIFYVLCSMFFLLFLFFPSSLPPILPVYILMCYGSG